MVWYGMGMVWYGMVWYGMVWYGMVWYGMVWYDIRYGILYLNHANTLASQQHSAGFHGGRVLYEWVTMGFGLTSGWTAKLLELLNPISQRSLTWKIQENYP